MSVASPYRGLSAFDDSELDALYFFGRERDAEIVVANLIASRFTVLYGPSGVGKSSLSCAAVARTLRELPEQPLVVVFSSWVEDPARALAETVAPGVGLRGRRAARDGSRARRLVETSTSFSTRLRSISRTIEATTGSRSHSPRSSTTLSG